MPKNGMINRYFGDAIMKAVVLITCTKHKHEGSHKAEFLYSASENFVKYLECARLMADDKGMKCTPKPPRMVKPSLKQNLTVSLLRLRSSLYCLRQIFHAYFV